VESYVGKIKTLYCEVTTFTYWNLTGAPKAIAPKKFNNAPVDKKKLEWIKTNFHEEDLLIKLN